MPERRKDMVALAGLLAVLVLFYSHILFSNKVIRAPDILNEYYWSALGLSKGHFLDFFKLRLIASWDIYGNSGNTLLGGEVGSQLVSLSNLVYYFHPPSPGSLCSTSSSVPSVFISIADSSASAGSRRSSEG